MPFTPCLIVIIPSLSKVIVLVCLRFCLNHSPFSFIRYCSEAMNSMFQQMIASLNQK